MKDIVDVKDDSNKAQIEKIEETKKFYKKSDGFWRFFEVSELTQQICKTFLGDFLTPWIPLWVYN